MPGCTRRYFSLPSRFIARFQFILEGYDGIATVSTLEPQGAVVMLCIPEGLEREVDRVLGALAQEGSVSFRELAARDDTHAA